MAESDQHRFSPDKLPDVIKHIFETQRILSGGAWEVPPAIIEDEKFRNRLEAQMKKALEMYMNASPHSTQEYMSIAAIEALYALAFGNNSVGASLVVVEEGIEYGFTDRNHTRSLNDPQAHAEARVFDRFQHRELGDLMWKRKAPPNAKNRRTLYTTWECCPSCARIALSVGVDEIVIATADPNAGVLLGERRENIEKIDFFRERLPRTKISAINFTDDTNEHYVAPEFRSLFDDYLVNEIKTIKEPKPNNLLGPTYEGVPFNFVGERFKGVFKMPKAYQHRKR